MRYRCVASVVLTLAVALAARPALADVKPAVVLRVDAVDNLDEQGRYLAELLGKGEEYKQFVATLKEKTGPKGLQGLDAKKPVGLYATVSKELLKSDVVVLLPIVDEKAFVKTLEKIPLKVEKGDDGLYTVKPESIPFVEKVMFRFANGYLYATVKANAYPGAKLDKESLPKPEDVLAEGTGSLAALTLNLDQIPNEFRDLALTQVSQHLAAARDKEGPGETKAVKTLRLAVLDEAGDQIKSILKYAATLSLRVDLDRKTNDASVALKLTPEAGSKLAKDIASMKPASSLSGSVSAADSAARLAVHLTLPERIRAVIGPAIDDAFKDALENEPAEKKRELAKGALDALKPTIKAGVLDAALDFRGPGAKGKATVLFVAAVKDGQGIEKAIRKAHDSLPKEARDNFTWNAEKVGDVNIHKGTFPAGNKVYEFLMGDGPGYVAYRDDALFLTMGEGSLPTIKDAIKAERRSGKVLDASVAVKRLVPFVLVGGDQLVKIANKVFKAEGDDGVTLNLTTGKALELKLTAKTPILTFAREVDGARDRGSKPSSPKE
jgi:hypothetical protein